MDERRERGYPFNTNAAVRDLFHCFTRPICRWNIMERVFKCDLKAIDPA
jgi:hypothetical protein